MRVYIEPRLRGFYFAQMVAPAATDDAEEDEESMDWWTKYFASIDTMIEVRISSSQSHSLSVSRNQLVRKHPSITVACMRSSQ